MNKNILIGVGVVVVVIIGWYVLMQPAPTSDVSDVATGTPSTVAETPATTTSDYHDNIYLTRTSTTTGAYMTDFSGMTLYTFDKDTSGTSTCTTAACTTLWKPYTSGATAEGMMPANITVITRADGSQQFAWKGKPLYYYTKDQNPGDMLGNNIGKLWHVVGM